MTIMPGPITVKGNSFTTSWRHLLSTTLDANGDGAITFQDMSHNYIIEQVCLQVDNGTGGAAVVEINNAFICGTASGALDSADGNPPIILHAGEQLSISWAGVTGGKAAHCTLIGKAVVYK